MDNKKVLIILGIATAFFAIWYTVTNTSNKQGLISTTTNKNDKTDIVISKFVGLLSQLGDISLDVSIFKNDAYKNLVDYHKDTIQEPLGRDNPFASIKGSGVTIEGGDNLSEDEVETSDSMKGNGNDILNR